MAQIVGGVGTSHSPMLLNNPEKWLERAGHDRNNPSLYDRHGEIRSYDELLADAGDRLAGELQEPVWQARHQGCHTALDRLAADIAELDCDAVVVVGDDQQEVFDDAIQPALAVYHGASWRSGLLTDVPPGEFFQNVKVGYAMDDVHEFTGEPELGRDLLLAAVEQGFDVTSMGRVPAGRGFGHAYGFIIRRLLGPRPVPVVPVLINTYYPPNQPTAERCYRFGQALAAGVAANTSSKRVLLVASGGLSHFVVDEDLDLGVLAAIAAGDDAALRAIPQELLNSGTSEIRNWLAVAGAMAGRSVAWSDYYPCYRTAAGTGCGMAFLRWE